MVTRHNTSIVSQKAHTEVSSRCRRVYHHPKHLVYYFQNLKAKSEAEMKFNKTKYYHNDIIITNGNQLGLETLHDELVSYPISGSPYGTPFRVMVNNRDDGVQPAYMPLIDDMAAYMHRGVVIFAKWLYRRICQTVPEYIPRELVPIFDMKTELDLNEIPFFSFPTESRDIILGAYYDGVHVMEMKSSYSLITVKVNSETILGNLEDEGTRYHHVVVSGEKLKKGANRAGYPKGFVVIICNAMNIHRPSFIDKFNQLLEAYNPMLMVITEARAKLPWLDYVRYGIEPTHKLCAVGPPCGLGGVAFAWDKRIEPYIEHKDICLFGHLLTLNAIPSIQLAGVYSAEDLPRGEYYLYGLHNLEEDYYNTTEFT